MTISFLEKKLIDHDFGPFLKSEIDQEFNNLLVILGQYLFNLNFFITRSYGLSIRGFSIIAIGQLGAEDSNRVSVNIISSLSVT